MLYVSAHQKLSTVKMLIWTFGDSLSHDQTHLFFFFLCPDFSTGPVLHKILIVNWEEWLFLFMWCPYELGLMWGDYMLLFSCAVPITTKISLVTMPTSTWLLILRFSKWYIYLDWLCGPSLLSYLQVNSIWYKATMKKKNLICWLVFHYAIFCPLNNKL